MVRIRADPDPQHWHLQALSTAPKSTGYFGDTGFFRAYRTLESTLAILWSRNGHPGITNVHVPTVPGAIYILRHGTTLFR